MGQVGGLGLRQCLQLPEASSVIHPVMRQAGDKSGHPNTGDVMRKTIAKVAEILQARHNPNRLMAIAQTSLTEAVVLFDLTPTKGRKEWVTWIVALEPNLPQTYSGDYHWSLTEAYSDFIDRLGETKVIALRMAT